MRTAITGFVLGAVLTVLALFFIHRVRHPFAHDNKLTLMEAGSFTIPRCDDLAPDGTAKAWGGRGFHINVLQDTSDFPNGSNDIPARAFLAWNKDSFLARVEVDVAQPIEAEKDNGLWLGDSVEFYFATGPDRKQSFQVIVAPGIDPRHPAKRELIGQVPLGSPTPFPVKTLSHRTDKGYAVEIAIPWSTLVIMPNDGQAYSVQILVNHGKPERAGEFEHVAWYPGADTAWQPQHKVPVVLGENASSPIDSLARIMALRPGTGWGAFTVAADAGHGHLFTVRHDGKILYHRKIDHGVFSFADAFTFPSEWNDSKPVAACDDRKILAELSRDEVLTQIQALTYNLAYRLNPSVFGQNQFPRGSFEQDDLVRRFFAPVKTTTTFYDAQYNVATQADKPGRYGAVVRISLNGGIELNKFITLYRTPAKVDWRDFSLPISAQLPSEFGIDPAVIRIQKAEIEAGIRRAITFNQEAATTPDLAILLAGLSETPPGAPPAVDRTNALAHDADWWYGLRQSIGMVETYPYLVDLPADYASDPNKRWPLILSLHGSGGRGASMKDLQKGSLIHMMGNRKELPAIVITPACPVHEWWRVQVLSRLLDEVSAKYRVDPDRVYVTGTSMGGFGTWALALAYPERFAAIVPLCGGGDPPDASRLKNVPVWAFHGQKDENVPPSLSLDMAEAVRKVGGHAHVTVYPDVGHDCWTKAYATDALYTWLLAQKRGQPEVITPGVPTP